MNPLIRRIAAALLALPLAIGAATAADAGTRTDLKASGNLANVYWWDVQDSGEQLVWTNGDLSFMGDKRVEAWGGINVIVCAADSTSPHDEGCEWTQYNLEGADVTLTVARKLDSARVRGEISLIRDDGAAFYGPVDITWTGYGATSTTRSSYTYTSTSGIRYTTRATETGRWATANGHVMDFTIADGEGRIGTYRDMTREVTP
jgi:hypothetical protein